MQCILVVDDDVLLVRLIAKALSDYDVITAHDGDDALRLVQPGTRLDLIISDYLMAPMMGDELIGRFRERRPSVKVLVITGHAAVLEDELAKWWTAESHLAKPFTMAALRESVVELIGPPDSLRDL